ncbi:PaaX family transcriptional regulator C-terminal domain-containing protein [Neobacillus sp. K501]
MTIENQTLYLLSKVQEIEGKEVIKIYEAMGYTPQSVRNIFSKLKKDHYIHSTGRSIYQITEAGKEFITSRYEKENFYNHIWDNKWFMVLSEIPETLRKKRDAFRKSLIEVGFGSLYKSVYIYPWDRTRVVLSIIDSLEIEEYVTILSSDDFIMNKISRDGSNANNQASRIWNLREVNDLYQEKLEFYKTTSEPHIAEFVSKKSQDYLQLFICYLKVDTLKNELLEKDPMLPPEFLPGNWMGTHVLSTLSHASEKIKRLIPESSIYFKFL